MLNHGHFEKNSIVLLIGILIVVSIGGLVEIAPLFYLKSTIEKVEGMRPYTPLELAGRNVYIREGCYTCHSQMIRALRDEVERYGHYSLAAESMYDHPFQWGSKRNGPDLARVGGKYSDEWHQDHFKSPRSVVPESIMPAYSFLATTRLSVDNLTGHIQAQQTVGVPYTDNMLANAIDDAKVQADPDADYDAFLERYPNAIVSNFDGKSTDLTELDALIAYMQMLGTLVDFSQYNAESFER